MSYEIKFESSISKYCQVDIVKPIRVYFTYHVLLSLSNPREVQLGQRITTEKRAICSVMVAPMMKPDGRLFVYLSILVSGDIQSNPGPTRKISNPCTVCKKGVIKSSKAVSCDECDLWTHIRCTKDISNKMYDELTSLPNFSYICVPCTTKSLSAQNEQSKGTDIDHINHNISKNCAMSKSPANNIGDHETTTNHAIINNNNNCASPKSDADVHDDEHSPMTNQFQHLIDIRKKHPKKFIAAHININSLRYKFIEIKELLTDKIVDVLFISETKLDHTFRESTLAIEGYQLVRRDRDKNGGGLAAYIRNDLPSRRRTDQVTRK